jgi:DnaA-homolog protein
MPEQLIFDLAGVEPPTFANFETAGNAEAVTTLQSIAATALDETGVVLWGASGGGKTHLLHAAVAAATDAGRNACYCEASDVVGLASLPTRSLIAVDDVDRATPEAQAALFTLYNALAASDGQLIVAASAPPVRLPLRSDLRTRLSHGLTYEIVPLTDADKRAALARFAQSRGFELANDVVSYLLAHGRRDMTSLLATLAALDRHSLAVHRAITVPLLREWLGEQRRSLD